ncbi:hypothetical protein FD755_015644, partial [Muntiacus reevesi]
LFSFTLCQRLFSSSSLSAITVVEATPMRSLSTAKKTQHNQKYIKLKLYVSVECAHESVLISSMMDFCKDTGVACHALFQGIFPTQVLNTHFCVSCIVRWILYHYSRKTLCFRRLSSLCPGVPLSPPFPPQKIHHRETFLNSHSCLWNLELLVKRDAWEKINLCPWLLMESCCILIWSFLCSPVSSSLCAYVLESEGDCWAAPCWPARPDIAAVCAPSGDIVGEGRLLEAVIKTIPKKKKCKKAKWLSEEGLQIAEKRREVKGKGEKERYTNLNAENLHAGQEATVKIGHGTVDSAGDIHIFEDESKDLWNWCLMASEYKMESVNLILKRCMTFASQGRMVQKGIYAEFPKPGIDFEDILLKMENEKAELPPGPGTPTLRKWSSSESSVLSLQSSIPSLEDAAPEDKDTENIQAIPSLESCSIGMVGFKIYKNCFRAGAHWFIIVFLILINVAAQVAYALQDWWLADWANEKSTIYAMIFGQGNMIVMPDPDWYLGTYSGLMVATGLFSITRSLLLIYILVNSSQTLHNEMLESILKAPVLFFDRNPIGKSDIKLISKHMFLFMTGVAVVMVGVIPWIAIPVIPLSIIFFLFRIYFLWTYGDIKRLECTTRSPVFSHLASSLQGLWSIRAYKAEQRFQEVFDAHQDLHSEAWFLLLTTFQWFAVRLDVICAVFFIVICFGSLMLAKTLNPGQFGLVLSLALTFTWIFQWCVRQSAEIEKMMVSAERVVEYMELEKEAPWEYEYRPPLDWPHEGELAFEDVNFRHTLDGPLVLKDLTECTDSKEKTGIVGRTGAGKSSLVAALFRLSEPRGGIWIDNISITSIGLHHLRKKMSVVPQEAVLFTGTMRKNLDPFDEHTNEELWNALEEVRLKEIIESLPGKMDTELVESGSNLSVGQRQLLCLARGILRKNQILIIDNATSHVDPRTDELIQKNIREKFSQCTVLTITHRLSTVIDSEWIMVWDSGRLDDYDEPYGMLQERDSLFYKMVQQLGEAEATALTERAKQTFYFHP